MPTPEFPPQIMRGRPHMHEGEIARAAAEIPDQDQFVMVERRFVVVRSRHRLHLKLNGFKSGNPEGLAESSLREVIRRLVFGSDEMNRAAHHSGTNFHPELTPGLLTQIYKNPRDQFLQPDPSAEDIRALQCPACQE